MLSRRFRALVKALFSPPIGIESANQSAPLFPSPKPELPIIEAKRWQLACRFQLIEALPAEDSFSIHIVNDELAELEDG
jgi:hypothetical protein